MPEASPCKSSQLASAASVEASPGKSSRLQRTPQKSDPGASSPRGSKTNTPETNPRKSSRLQNTPKKATVAEVAVTPTAKGAKKNLRVQLTTLQACDWTESDATWKVTKCQVLKVCMLCLLYYKYIVCQLSGSTAVERSGLCFFKFLSAVSHTPEFCVLLRMARHKAVTSPLSVCAGAG